MLVAASTPSLLSSATSATPGRLYTHVAIVDLRGVGRSVQWVATDRGRFHPGRYIEALQLPYVAGFSVIVRGRQDGPQGHLRVVDGEVLEVLMKPITPSLSGEDDFFDDGGEDEDGSDGDALPHSSDLSSGEPIVGQGPFGPPPPQPVNCPGSTSPP